MLKGMDELAMENGMLPPKGLCAECWKGTYVAIVEDYHIGGETIKDLDLKRCPRCRHTILPWQSVERVDKVLEEARKAKKSL
jgi:DNA-directed RNA polymerase subunit RPC12/RpoP